VNPVHGAAENHQHAADDFQDPDALEARRRQINRELRQPREINPATKEHKELNR
jgi:hypothetical protein